MSEYKSGINGCAEVFFGGKILIGVKRYAKHHAFALCLSEADKEYPVASRVTEADMDFDKPDKVYLTFDNVKSVEVVERWLGEIKKLLVEIKLEDHEEREDNT